MNRFSRLIACSVLVVAPALGVAQGNSDQMPRGGMMNQGQMQMQAMMQEMRNASSAEERQRIRERHMEAMQDHMGMMRGGMMGQGMMGQGMMGGRQQGQGMMGNGQGMMNNQGNKLPGNNAREDRSGAASMDNQQRMDMMQNRMNQMQLMMEQMLEHQQQLERN